MPTRDRNKRRKSCGSVTQTLERVSTDLKALSFERTPNSGSAPTSRKKPRRQQLPPSAILHAQRKGSAPSHCHSPNTNRGRCTGGKSCASPQTLGLRQQCRYRAILFSCNQCPKSFEGKANYLRHILVHTGERPHCCLVCDRGFSQMVNLQRHMKIHSRKRGSPATAPRHQTEVSGQLRLEDSGVKRGLKPQSFFSLDQEGQESSAIDRSLAEILAPLRSELDRIGIIAEGDRSSPSGLVVSNDAGGNPALEEQPEGGTGSSVYQCPKCSRRFTCKASLNRHLKVHTGEKPYSCPVCGCKFNQESNCQRHQQLHLSQGRLKKRGSVRKSDGHYWTTMPLGQDDEARETVADGSQLLVDTGIVENQMESEDENFRETCRAAESICKFSLDELNMGGELGQIMEKIGAERENEELSCLDQHLKTQHLNEAGTVDLLGPGVNPSTEGIGLSGSNTQCHQCGRNFHSRANLKKHMLIHSGRRPYSCPDCGQTFNQSGNALRHQRSHYRGRSALKSSNKGEGAVKRRKKTRKRSQNVRLRAKIIVECQGSSSAHPCLETKEQENVKEGINESSEPEDLGSTPAGQPAFHSFLCYVCGLGFLSKGSLEIHERGHKENEQPYDCNRRERRFHCPRCGRGFAHMQNVSRHLLVHTGEKPWHCGDCGRRFNQASNLNRHCRTQGHQVAAAERTGK
ncbi:hypothetical protein SKAU_G00417340 [Synaphobranchus kaupii]|uniref:C2H2-type domain-containing protein n=1 Tax=Synaphobranchus kaupii TaxID=118154 RepID=A0A9Q1E5W8_SYNKA|nr:hypothetical protein SKAU_G00417340 [Synaphobranchus kaupii]